MASIACNSGAYTLIGAASFAAWVLGVSSGSYALTGTAVTPVHGYKVSAVSGTYSVTGTAIQTRRLTASPAGYILNGTDASLLYSAGSKVLSIASGSYGVTGTTATKVERGVPYTRGRYTFTGSPVSLVRSVGPKFTAASGSYSLTGTASGLKSTVSIASGDYNITGTAVTFRKGKNFVASPGGYLLSGFPSTKLEQSRHFSSLKGTYSITGAVTTLRYSSSKAIFIVINNGLYALSGGQTNLLMNRVLSAAIGSYTIADGHTVFRKQYDTGNYGVTGSPVGLVVGNRTLAAGIGSYNLSGVATQLIYSIHNFIAEPGVYTIANPATVTTRAFLLTNPSGIYTIASPDAFLRATHLNADAGVYSIINGVTNIRASRIGRWRSQSKQPVAMSKQPAKSTTWDPEQGSSGV